MRPQPPRSVRVLAILWPAFLMAGVLEMLVFSLVDPTGLHWFGGEAVTLSPSGVYTLAFFVFWGVLSTASGLNQLLNASAEELNGSAGQRFSRTSPNWPH